MTPAQPALPNRRSVWPAFAATALSLAVLNGCDGPGASHQEDHADAAHPHEDAETHDLATGEEEHADEEEAHDHAGEEEHDHEADAHDHAGEEEHSDEVTLTTAAIEQYSITVEPAALHSLRPTIVTPARVGLNTQAMSQVGSTLDGRVVEIKAVLGQGVGAGEPLIVVESPELGAAQADYLQQRLAVEATRPGVELAKVSWDRARSLHTQTQGISLAEVQRREAEHTNALAALRAAEAELAGMRNRLILMGMDPAAIVALETTGTVSPASTITAPIAGLVVQSSITLGELVGPEHGPLMVIADTSTFWVLAHIPEARIGEVGVGAKAWVSVGDSDADRYEGEVSFISPFIDASTRTAQARVVVPSAALAVRPGMFARVEIAAAPPGNQSQAPVLAVPREAVMTVEGAPSVFVPVPGEPNTFARREVVVGPAVGGMAPVLSGLAEGEPVVVSGVFILKADLGKGSAAHEH